MKWLFKTLRFALLAVTLQPTLAEAGELSFGKTHTDYNTEYAKPLADIKFTGLQLGISLRARVDLLFNLNDRVGPTWVGPTSFNWAESNTLQWAQTSKNFLRMPRRDVEFRSEKQMQTKLVGLNQFLSRYLPF